MKTKQAKPVTPQGNSVVCPYLMVDSVEDQMEFLVKVLNAEITEDARRGDGLIQHGEVLIGDTTIMMGRSSKDFPARQSMNYVYVTSTDETHQRALTNGATEIMPPADRFYGIRESGFVDKYGNQWWVAQVLEVLTKEELHKRTAKL
jgi:PhnB protein